MGDAASTRTDGVTFSPLKFERREALAKINRVAELRGVRIASIEERPRRLSVDILVIVTGDANDVASFCKLGHREGDPPRTVRGWVGAVIDALFANWAGR